MKMGAQSEKLISSETPSGRLRLVKQQCGANQSGGTGEVSKKRDTLTHSIPSKFPAFWCEVGIIGALCRFAAHDCDCVLLCEPASALDHLLLPSRSFGASDDNGEPQGLHISHYLTFSLYSSLSNLPRILRMKSILFKKS